MVMQSKRPTVLDVTRLLEDVANKYGPDFADCVAVLAQMDEGKRKALIVLGPENFPLAMRCIDEHIERYGSDIERN